ncbi:MAG: SPFH domain-containing protein [Ruminococcus sp.]|nr:SPFH domain-containing protein [Ruminococcus sp.]
MSEFAIECPVCGKYVEAKTGIFASKQIACSCGNIINVKTDKLTTRKCEHCGNVVVYDQSKSKSKCICPVCHTEINTLANKQQEAEFSCAQCGIKLSTIKSATKYTCPVCDYENDVQECLAKEKIKHDGLASIIKFEGNNDALVWKHPIEDFNLGSQLIVHESQEAIFFKDGQALDLFGPGRYTLETQQLPLLEKIYKLPTDTEGTFHSEVYFINKTVQMSIRWGTPDKVRFIDPLTGVPLSLGASGEMNLQVSNARKLIVKLVGTMNGIAWEDEEGLSKSLQKSFRPLIVNAVKTNLPSVIKSEAIDILEIDENLDIISQSLRKKISAGFEEYGLTIPQFYVTAVVLPEEDPNFKRIRDLHTITLQTRVIQAEATVKTAQAQSETQYRTAQEQSKAAIEEARRQAELQRQTTETEVAKREAERTVIAAQAEAQAARMAGLTEAEVMKAKGYTEKDVLQAEVQKAYAAGLGEMGSGGGINVGGGSSVMGDMLGMGIGLAAAGAVAPQIGNMMQGLNPNAQNNAAGTNTDNAPQPDTWDCSCGQKNIVGNFCNNCGSKRPTPEGEETWNCSCGKTGNTGKFCSNCGAKRADDAQATWDCSCGKTGNTGNFCNNCGKKKEN